MESSNPRPNPYVGPRAFQTGERLYGRDTEVRELTNLLIAERVVLLHSPSGAGKSSLVQAGLIPALQAEGFRVLPVIRVNQELPLELSENRQVNRYMLSVLLSLEEGLPEQGRLSFQELAGLSLDDYLARRTNREGADPAHQNAAHQNAAHQNAELEAPTTMLLFDQFEEILTIEPTDREAKLSFFNDLGKALRDRKRWALFVMREDYLPALDPYLRPIPTRLANTYRLDLLGVEPAHLAIQQPIQASGVKITHEAVHKLVNDLRLVQVQQADGTMKTQAGPHVEPVQLQVVCYHLWQQLRADQQEITAEDVAVIGNVDQSLADYYAERVAAAAKQAGVRERSIRDWFDSQLITESGSRGQVLMEPEQSKGLSNRAIASLVDAHLVRAEKRLGATWFELSHDRLILPIRANNQTWFQANLSLLERQAALWEKENRPEHLLLRDQALMEAEEWAANHLTELIGSEIDFLKECREVRAREQAERERAEQAVKLDAAEKVAVAERRRAEEQALSARKLRQRAIFLALLLVVAVILAGAAAFLGNQANINAQEANFQSTRAVAQQITAESASTLAVGNEATAVYERGRAVQQQTTAEAASTIAIQQKNLASTAQADEAVQRATAQAEALLRATAEAQALEQKDIALSRQRAALSLSYLEQQPDLALLLAVEAYQTGATWEAKNALLTGLLRGLGRKFQRLPLPPAGKGVYSVALSPDGKTLAWAREDGLITIWDYQANQPVHELSSSSSRVWSISFSPNAKRLAVAAEDSSITLWDAQSGNELVRIPNINKVVSISWSPDGSRLAAAVGPHMVVWELTGRQRYSIGDETFDINLGFEINEVAWSPDGQWIAAAASNAIVYVLKAEDGTTARQLTGHQDKVRSVAWAPDSASLASGGNDRQVFLWDLATSEGVSLAGHTDQVLTVAFSFDGSLLASGSEDEDKSIIVWDVTTQQMLARLQDYGRSVESVHFIQKAGSVLLAAGSLDTNIGLYEVITEQPLGASLALQPGSVAALGRSGDGTILAARYSESQRNMKINHLIEGVERPLWDNVAKFRPVISAAFSLDGLKFAYGDDQGRIVLVDLETGQELPISFSPPGPAYALALNERNLASSHCTRRSDDQSSCTQNEIWLWDLATGIPRPTSISGHADFIRTLAFIPDGSLLASGSQDGTIVHWQVETQQPEGLPLSRHLGAVTGLTFSPDGNRQASGSIDLSIILWDEETDQPIGQPLTGFSAGILGLVFSSDDQILYGGTQNGEIIAWDVSYTSWIERACRLAGRSLSEAEWLEFFPMDAYSPACQPQVTGTPTPTP